MTNPVDMADNSALQAARLEPVIFRTHPRGRPVLGSTSTILSTSRAPNPTPTPCAAGATHRAALATLLTVLLAATACSSQPPSSGYPDQPPVRPAEMNYGENYNLQGFDYCSPFNDQRFDQWARRIDLPKPQPTGCAWRGQDINATITLETGRTIVDISNDPAYRPGGRDFDYTAGWMTGVRNESPTCDWFVSTGRNTPDQLLHIHTQITTDDDEPHAPTSWGPTHACTFAEHINDSMRYILEFGKPLGPIYN